MAWDANDAAGARWIVPLSRQDQSPTPLKKSNVVVTFHGRKIRR
jgi:hypothetical protein